MKSIGLTWTVRAVLFAALATAAAQHTVQNAEGPLKSSDELLASIGIQLTGPALVLALQNRDPEVRALAALSLAQHQAYGAAPIIENALAGEPAATTQIAMADALWELKDRKGVEHLQAMCANTSMPVWVLVGVVQLLSGIGQSSSACFDPIVNYVEAGADISERRQISLDAMPGLFRSVDSEKAAHIVSILEEMLIDNDPTVRMQASHTLVQIDLRSSANSLRKAIWQETDATVRSDLQNDLTILEGKKAEGR